HDTELVKIVTGSVEAYASASEGFLKALDAGKDEFAAAIFISRLNKNYVRIRRSLSSLNTIEVKSATAAVKALRTTGDLVLISALTAGLVILALIISVLFSRRITDILRSVLKSVRQFGQGDFSGEVPVTSSNEFGEVQQGLESMRRDLSGIIALVKDTSSQIVSAMDNVSSISERIRASSKDSQSRALTVAAASDEMVSTTNDIAKNCEAAARDAGETNKITQQSIASVQQTIDIIKKQAEKTLADADQIAALSEQADKVSTIVETIESIASQTNLLALNAAIEAARAGEAGKGFAVVADEVRTLASRTSRSTQEITKMVTGIQDGAKACNESMAKSCENMNQIAASSDGIKETLGKVSSQVSGVSEEISQVTNAVEQQNLATSEISTNMQQITTSAKELSDDAAGCDSSVGTAQGLLRDLSERLVRIKLGDDAMA
ncbi:MAG: methyl-accepting chemotaxis protein, partial [Succinivibrio sp.]